MRLIFGFVLVLVGTLALFMVGLVASVDLIAPTEVILHALR